MLVQLMICMTTGSADAHVDLQKASSASAWEAEHQRMRRATHRACLDQRICLGHCRYESSISIARTERRAKAEDALSLRETTMSTVPSVVGL